jgi:hypothetical protein
VIQENLTNICYVVVSFVKVGPIRDIIYLVCLMNFIRMFDIYFPIWVKFGIRNLNIILLRIRVISGFHRGVNDIFALLGCYA